MWDMLHFNSTGIACKQGAEWAQDFSSPTEAKFQKLKAVPTEPMSPCCPQGTALVSMQEAQRSTFWIA